MYSRNRLGEQEAPTGFPNGRLTPSLVLPEPLRCLCQYGILEPGGYDANSPNDDTLDQAVRVPELKDVWVLLIP